MPVPDLDFVDTFKKSHIETTKPVPYNLRVNSRGQEKMRKLREKVGLGVDFRHTLIIRSVRMHLCCALCCRLILYM